MLNAKNLTVMDAFIGSIEMDDLINRQALLRDIEKYHLSDGMFQHWVEVQPSVDAVEAVRHGHWVTVE